LKFVLAQYEAFPETAPVQPRQPTDGWANEETILKHIAEALRWN